MFALKLRNGDLARMRDGQPFLYTSRDLARRGVRALAKTVGWTSVIEI